MTITRRTGLIAGAFLLATASLAQAADWPVDPITFMVTTPTGGSEDRLVRTLAPYLAEELGVPVVVENIDGAQGILGADRLLRQGGDGSLIASSTIARLIGHIQAGRTSFQLADFEFLNVPDDEYALVVATSAATFDNAEGLVDSLTSGAAPIMADPTGTGPAIMMTIFLEKLKVAPDAYRVSGLGGFEADWFTHGVLTWTSGPRNGRVERIADHRRQGEDALLYLVPVEGVQPEPGNTFSILAGCDKSFASCRQKFANHLRFRGFPHLPGNDSAYAYVSDGLVFDGEPLVP